MSMFKRIFFLIATNILIVITISLILRILGIAPYLTARGIDYNQLMAFCLVWGFGGAFISLLLSKFMAKTFMGVKIIDPQTNQPELKWLVETVQQLSYTAGMKTPPEVGIYEGSEVNAFATGPTKSRSLVAVSTGLMRSMDRTQIEGVLGHEIAHINNGDMVTMTLIQGVVNAFVMFLSRAIAFAISNAGSRDNDERSSAPSFLLVMVLEMVLGFFGMMIVAWFSRMREFRADRGGAMYAGKQKMISALTALQRSVEGIDQAHPALATLKISGRRNGLLALFSTHPPLEERIERLKEIQG